MSDPDPRDWSRHPLAPLLSRVEGAISQRHPPGSKAPITAEEMAGALSEDRSDPALSEVSILPDYLPVQLPPGRRRLVSTIGDYGMVGSSLTSTAQFLAPPGSPAPPTEEVILWARKWEARIWEMRPREPYQGKRVWLKIWGEPALLLQA